MEQQVANSILKDLRSLPILPQLSAYVKFALDSPIATESESIKNFLNWLLTGKYTQGILSENDVKDYLQYSENFTAKENPVIIQIIKLIEQYKDQAVNYNPSTPLLNALHDTPGYDQLVKAAEMTQRSNYREYSQFIDSFERHEWVDKYKSDPKGTVLEIMKKLRSLVFNTQLVSALIDGILAKRDLHLTSETKVSQLVKVFNSLYPKETTNINNIFQELASKYHIDANIGPNLKMYADMMRSIYEQIPDYDELFKLARNIVKQRPSSENEKFIKFLDSRFNMLSAYESDPERIIPEIRSGLYSIIQNN